MTLIINWGDGSSPQTVNLPAGSTTFSQPHTYLGTGAESVNVTIGDNEYSNNVLFGGSGDTNSTDPPGQLFAFDLNSGATTLIGNLPAMNVSEIVYNQATGEAWLEYRNGTTQQFDINTGAAIGGLITNLPSSPTSIFNALVYIGNTLYGSSTPNPGDTTASDLRTLDPVIGASTVIGATHVNAPIGGLAYDPTSGILYGIYDTTSGSTVTTTLATINPNTGAATTLFTTTNPALVGAKSRLRPGRQPLRRRRLEPNFTSLRPGTLYRIDLTTHAITPVSTINDGPFVPLSGLTQGNDTASVQTTVDPAITLSPSTLPPDTANIAYNQTIKRQRRHRRDFTCRQRHERHRGG